jgi:hypothetical protein
LLKPIKTVKIEQNFTRFYQKNPSIFLSPGLVFKGSPLFYYLSKLSSPFSVGGNSPLGFGIRPPSAHPSHQDPGERGKAGVKFKMSLVRTLETSFFQGIFYTGQQPRGMF